MMDNFAIRRVTMYSSFTCIYVPLLILMVLYTENLYNIGKFSTSFLLISLLAAELIKLGIWMFASSSNTKDQKLKLKKGNGSKIKVKEVFKSVLVVAALVGVFYFIIVLFGAPFSTEQEETLMLSLLLSILTTIPACFNLGSETTVSLLSGIKPMSGDLMQEMVARCIYTTLFGTWLGAVVIPLDWDRPWQAWPIPCSLGAVAGYLSGHIYTLAKLMPSIAKLFSRCNGIF